MISGSLVLPILRQKFVIAWSVELPDKFLQQGEYAQLRLKSQ